MTHPRNSRHLTLAELTSAIDEGTIDTVVVAFTDMQGRLQASACTAGTSSTSCSSTAPRDATTCWGWTSR